MTDPRVPASSEPRDCANLRSGACTEPCVQCLPAASSEPRPENPYRTVHARMSPPGAAWDEGFAACRAAFDAVVAERDQARADLAAVRQFTADQIERAGSMSERQEDQIEAQIRDAGRYRIELDKRARCLSHLERALKHLREFVQDGEVRRVIDAALDGEDWDA